MELSKETSLLSSIVVDEFEMLSSLLLTLFALLFISFDGVLRISMSDTLLDSMDFGFMLGESKKWSMMFIFVFALKLTNFI